MSTCIRGNSMVWLGDGTSKYIYEMWQEQYTGSVRSYDPDAGCFVNRKVIGWNRERFNARRLLKVSTTDAKGNAQGLVGPVMAEDNRVLSRRGWLNLCDIEASDEIATGDVELRGVGRSVVLGLVLGDGHIPRTKQHLTVCHVVRNEDYSRLLFRSLQALGAIIEYRDPPSRKPQWEPQWTVRTSASRWIGHLREMFYTEDARKIPSELCLDPLMLAVWYMDDGYLHEYPGRSWRPHATFCQQNRLAVVHVEKQCQMLQALGIDAYVVREDTSVGISADGTETLAGIVAPYLPTSMQYKLPPEYRGCFQDALWTAEPPGTCWSSAVLKEMRAGPTEKSGYGLTVDGTHNFVVAGVVVRDNLEIT